jgi:uncharacterized protein YgiM (DUF1202 family)
MEMNNAYQQYQWKENLGIHAPGSKRRRKTMSRNRNNNDISTKPKTQMEQAVDEIEKKVETAETGELEKAAEPLKDDLTSAATTVKTEAPVLGVVINCDNLRVREMPTTMAETITTLPKKTVVKILDRINSDWIKVQETETVGYCMSKFIEIQ